MEQGSRQRWNEADTAVRALQSPDGASRRAACIQDGAEIRLRLVFSKAYRGALHLYAVDWDSTEQRQTMTIDDGSGPRSAAITTAFNEGAWVSASIDVKDGSSVSVVVTRTAGAHAVLSGVFLGGDIPLVPVPVPIPTPVQQGLPAPQSAPAQYSADGRWWWNGAAWVATQGPVAPQGPLASAPVAPAPAAAGAPAMYAPALVNAPAAVPKKGASGCVIVLFVVLGAVAMLVIFGLLAGHAPSSTGETWYLHWSCGQSSQCASVMGGPTGVQTSFSSRSDCESRQTSWATANTMQRYDGRVGSWCSTSSKAADSGP